jgi:hypothetical protein
MQTQQIQPIIEAFLSGALMTSILFTAIARIRQPKPPAVLKDSDDPRHEADALLDLFNGNFHESFRMAREMVKDDPTDFWKRVCACLEIIEAGREDWSETR